MESECRPGLPPASPAYPFSLQQSSTMRRLFLIRHAKAEPSVGRDDYERALTDRGRDDARRVAEVLRARDLLPDVLIHSGALRTKQTAEIFAAEWPRRVELQEELGLYDATQGMLFARARALADAHASVGFVGAQSRDRRARRVAGRLRRASRSSPDGGKVSDLRRGRARLSGRRLGRGRARRPRCSPSS